MVSTGVELCIGVTQHLIQKQTRHSLASLVHNSLHGYGVLLQLPLSMVLTGQAVCETVTED